MDAESRAKPILEKEKSLLDSSMIIKRDETAWNTPWHFHPEVELFYCTKAKGIHFIGNYVSPIEERELVLIGRNLPHTRQTDKSYYFQHRDEIAQSITLKFKENFLGDHFFAINEFVHIDTLLIKARQGMKFYGETYRQVVSVLKKMDEVSPLPTLLQLVAILDILGHSEEFIFLNADISLQEGKNEEAQKIEKVFWFTTHHFSESISLSDVAEITNYSKAAFCRFFKQYTRKSYFQYLSEIRISNACKLLMEEDMDIAQVSYSSGFNNHSNFHKQFKKIVNLTPKEYREKGRTRTRRCAFAE
jgi:AraC-like DNA-binding protein